MSNQKIFELSKRTPYPVKDINNFMLLTGIDIDESTKILKTLMRYGIPNLKAVNMLIKLGYCSF